MREYKEGKYDYISGITAGLIVVGAAIGLIAHWVLTHPWWYTPIAVLILFVLVYAGLWITALLAGRNANRDENYKLGINLF
jgi:threonine/homoserine/homoserine lactone efflux protein